MTCGGVLQDRAIGGNERGGPMSRCGNQEAVGRIGMEVSR